jgi:NADPH:quinone reductase-like Zn-dependent oxidoreductase
MEAITISHPSAPPQISSDIAIPEPGDGQILVKTIYTAINPVYFSLPHSLAVFH